jgi:hypothetical protein
MGGITQPIIGIIHRVHDKGESRKDVDHFRV